MNPAQTVETTFWAAIALRTIGAVDPKNGPRYLPPPSAYVAIYVTWMVLGLFTRTRFARGAAMASLVLTLTTLVLGGAGAKLVGLFQTIAANYQTPGPAPTNPAGQNTSQFPTQTGAAATPRGVG